MTTYLDPRSGRTYPLEEPRWCGDGRAPLLLSDLPGLARADIATGVRSIWRYAAALPFLPAATPAGVPGGVEVTVAIRCRRPSARGTRRGTR